MSYIISGPLNLPMLIIQKFLRSFVNRSKFFSPPREQKLSLSIFIDSSIRDFRIYNCSSEEEERGQKMFNKSSADGRLIRKKSGTAPRAALVIYVNAAEVGEPGPVIIVFSRM